MDTINKIVVEARTKINDEYPVVSEGEFKVGIVLYGFINFYLNLFQYFSIKELSEEIHQAVEQQTPVAPQQPVEVLPVCRENLLPPVPPAPIVSFILKYLIFILTF